MKFEGKSKRLRERLELSLPVRVYARESLERDWVEMTRLQDVTPFGAGLAISRPTEPGRLIYLTMAMPRQLRCFDHVEPQYRVWALVRNIKTLPPTGDKPPRYKVGVAFVGKHPPASYERDPLQRYQVAASPLDSGLWDVEEQPERATLHVRSDDPRPETRHHIPIEVVVEIFDEHGKVSGREKTVTENISRKGAAIFTTLEVERGRFVRMSSPQYDITVIGAVRAKRPGADGIMRLHLEFIDQEWPLQGIE